MSDYANSIEERLNRHPILKNRVESLLNIVENSSGDASTADDAEKRVVQELRQMGNEMLNDWALEKESVAVEGIRNHNEKVIGHGKKTLLAYHIRKNSNF